MKNSDECPETSEPHFIISERFEVVRKLGKGGMGEIFLAQDKKLMRHVAIKKISSPVIPQGTLKKRFMREAQTASQIDHQNICTVYEIYEDEDSNYIVMQYIDGVSLERLIKLKQLRVGKIVDVCIQLCIGMSAAHSRGVIHRDLKPSNIMIDQNGVVKILDFGLAKMKPSHEGIKAKKGDSHLTQKGFVIGTVAYMSPEQARGEELDLRTDIFSFGCILYEMLEGKDPFDDTEQIGILYNVLNKKVTFSRKIPKELTRIIQKALAKKKKRRYDSFEKLQRDLEQFRLKLNGMEAVSGAEDSPELEHMSALVKRIKTFDSSSIRHHSRIRRYARSWPVMTAAFLIVTALVFFLFFTSGGSGGPGAAYRVYLLLDQFENETGDQELSEQARFLLLNSLNQYEDLKAIDIKKFSHGVDPLKKFSVKFRLSGRISNIKNSVNIDAQLRNIDGTGSHSFTVPGLMNRNSLLHHQVDTLSKRVFTAITGREPKAVEFKKISNTFGNSWESFKLLVQGKEYQDKLMVGLAQDYLSRAKEIPVAQLYLADLYLFGGRRKQAARCLEEARPHIRLMLPWMQLKFQAMEARLAFDFKEEIRILEALKDEFPFQKQVFFELGEAYFTRGNAEKAIPYYLQAVELADDFSLAINHLGYCYSYLGEHTRAIEVFERYRDLDRSANSFDSLGDGYFYSGDLVSAEACKKAAIAMEDGNPTWSFRTLANIYTLRSQYPKALSVLNELASKNPELRAQLIYLNRKAFISYLEKDFDTASEILNSAFALFSQDQGTKQLVDTHWLMGLVRLAQGRVVEARAELTRLKEMTDRFRLSADNYSHPYKYFVHLDALILEKTGHPAQANKRFLHLISLKTQLSFRTTYYNYQFFCIEYAKFKLRQRKQWEALTCVDKCLEYSGNYLPALRFKVELMKELGLSGTGKLREKISSLLGNSKG